MQRSLAYGQCVVNGRGEIVSIEPPTDDAPGDIMGRKRGSNRPESDNMNPYTQFLSQWSTDRTFTAFVDDWDRLERLVIGVYRGKVEAASAQSEFEELWPRLREHYPRWEPILRSHWQATQAAGEPTQTDPFNLLLAIESPAAIPGDWRAMQHLPAAREAINRYLVERGKSAG